MNNLLFTLLLLPAKITELKQPKCREKPTILVQISMQYSVITDLSERLIPLRNKSEW